jgi:pimeloyl-ACP methyl ester carboxylesterase
MTTTAVSTTKTLTVVGIGPVELTVDEYGDGQPFLVLHGGAGQQSVARFARLLADRDRNQVLAPTHPGFGGTPRPDRLNSVARLAALYSGLLDDLGLEDVTVIGNSVGGWIAAELALLGSPRLSRIVLLDAVGIGVEDHPVANISGLSLPEIQALSFHDPTPFRVDPASIPDAQKAILAANGAALAVYVGSPAMADPTLLGRLTGISIPTLVLWGESDQIVKPAYGQAYAAAIHGARFEVLSATGHMPQMETPDLVLQTIWEWCQGHTRTNLIELTRVQPFEAEVTAARLHAFGIEATIGAGSVYGSVSFAEGVPVLVSADDAPRARALLETGRGS